MFSKVSTFRWWNCLKTSSFIPISIPLETGFLYYVAIKTNIEFEQAVQPRWDKVTSKKQVGHSENLLNGYT